MHCILGAVSTEKSSNGLRSFRFGSQCIGGTNLLTPRLNGILSDKLHSNGNITGDESLKVLEKRFLAVLAIELTCGSCAESGHLQFIDHETVGLDGADD